MTRYRGVRPHLDPNCHCPACQGWQREQDAVRVCLCGDYRRDHGADGVCLVCGHCSGFDGGEACV